MKRKLTLWRRVLRTVTGESGATFIEYALLAGLVAIVVAIAVAVFGKRLKGVFSTTASRMDTMQKNIKTANINGAFNSVNN